MRLELSSDEADALKDVLDEKLVHLAWEINRTDHLDLKNALKATERRLDHVLDLLTHPAAARRPGDQPM
jgi:hypothetical protein